VVEMPQWDKIHQLVAELFPSPAPEASPRPSLVEAQLANEAARIELQNGTLTGSLAQDAAAVLRGLNQLWGLGLSLEKLLELARQLGSDVSFFLYGGTALVEGRGEIVTPLPPLPHRWVVLAIPSMTGLSGKTKRLYESLTTNHYTDGGITRRLVEELRKGGEFTPSLLFNTFENVAFTRFSGLGVAREHLVKIGATDVHLAGSGPALFTMVEDKGKAEELCLLLQNQNLEPYLTETL